MSDRPGAAPASSASGSTSGSTQLVNVPTETSHGRTPAVDRPALTPPATTPNGGGDRGPKEIERDIELTRERLATTIDEISERVKPANVARRGKESLEAQIRTPDGQLRTERVAIAAAVAGSLVALRLVRAIRAYRRARR